MKPGKLWNSSKWLEQPPETYTHGKNGIWDMNINAVQNERGFRISSISIPYNVNGIIETDSHPIIFSTNETFSAIGFFDEQNDVYIPIINDATKSYKFGFSISRPIKGEARRNFKDEVEICWFEYGNVNPPRFLNTVELGLTLNDYLLFPQAIAPKVDLSIGGGGNLGMGAYFVAVRYLKKDGTQTRYSTLSSPLFAVDENWNTIPGTNTGKALTIALTDLDTRFDTMIIVVVQRINGVDIPYELPELNVASSVTFIYTGGENQAQITMDEVLIPSAFYENVGAMTQLNDQLFLGDMTEETIIDWQKYANLVTLKWKSTLIDGTVHPRLAGDSGKVRGYMHQEVYCFYLVLKLSNGRSSRGFLVSGPKPISGDLVQSSLASAQDMASTPVFWVEDTCRNINMVDNTGDFGIWINQDEVYPNTDDFNSATLGGEDLRGLPVRHHRFPSLNFCKTNFYTGNNDYGRALLDVLGVEVSNVQIPPELQDKVVGWELHYATRDFNNATVLGQSLLMFSSHANLNYGVDGGLSSTGGNWASYQRTHSSGAITDPESMKPVNNYFRFHALDMLISKPSVSPTHLAIQLAMVINFGGNQNIAQSNANVVVYILDYTNGAGDVNPPTATNLSTQYLRKVDKGQYLVNDEVSGPYSNIRLEGCYAGHFPTPGTGLMESGNYSWARRDYDNGANTPPAAEQNYLANLMSNRRNVYLSFYSQGLTRTGQVFDTDQTGSDQIIYGGDTFVSLCSFNGYGLVTSKDINNVTGITDWKTLPTDGIKTAHVFLAETVANGAARYELPGNIYSQFYPKASTGNGTAGYLEDYSRDVEPNQIGYSKDDSAVGNLLNGIAPASPFDQFVERSPYKVTRSIKQIAEGKVNNWKNYNALDYFEVVKNRGPIKNLQGFGEILIIHLQDGFFRTRDKAVIATDITSITLGSGDIFAIEPKEPRPSKLGYAGTQHPLACYLTPAGYVFPDARTGEFMIYSGGDEIDDLGEGVKRYLQKYMRITDTNIFNGNGITIGYDYQYKRILLTIKNLGLVSLTDFKPGYVPTTEFIDTLTEGVSIVYRKGRFQIFQGVNSSEFECPPSSDLVLDDFEATLDEHSAHGTLIGDPMVVENGTPGYLFSILSGNTGGALSIDNTGQISVGNSLALDFSITPFVLTIRVVDSLAKVTTGTATINLNHVESTPVYPAKSFNLREDAANGTDVGIAAATDRDGKIPAYSILSGDSAGVFAMDPVTGDITVADRTTLDYTIKSIYTLSVQAICTLGPNTATVTTTVTINLVFVPVTPVAPSGPSNEFWVFPDQTVIDHIFEIGLFTLATSRDTVYYVVGTITPNPMDFSVIVEPTDSFWRHVRLLNSVPDLVSGVDNIIPMTVYNIYDPSKFATFNIVVHVYFYNTNREISLVKDDCPDGMTGSSVMYIVPAKTYYGHTQVEANDLADADLAANGQAYANAHGTCS